MSLFDSCICSSGRTLKVCDVFTSFQKPFMKTYVDYFLRIKKVIDAFTLIIKSKRNVDFMRTYETCLSNCIYQQYNFSVNDLLLQPFQRMSRYHLLVKELRKRRENNASDDLKMVMDDTLKVYLSLITCGNLHV
jgi:hypothetical protein